MGCNYYVKTKACETCGRGGEDIHLGKSSIGWAFMLQANGFKYYKNWSEMKAWLMGQTIYDEYDREFAVKDFIHLVEIKKDIKDPEPVDYGDDLSVIDGYQFYDCEFS